MRRTWFFAARADGHRKRFRIAAAPVPKQTDARRRASARQLDTFLDHQLAAHGLPSQALALLGFSQGAGLAYEVGPRRRDQLAGIVAIAGRMKRKDAIAAEIRSKPPFLILTGGGDRLLTTAEITQTAVALSAASIPAIRVLKADTGHGVSDEGIAASRDFLKGVLQTEVPATA